MKAAACPPQPRASISVPRVLGHMKEAHMPFPRKRTWMVTLATVTSTLMVAVLAPGAPATATSHEPGSHDARNPAPSESTASQSGKPKVTTLATFVDGPCADDICGSGSTIGPDGALYVTDSTAGRIQRIHPRSGAVTTYADGLPRQIAGVVGGGVADIAFRGPTAYVLVNGVSEFWTELIGSSNAPAAEGIYRLDRVGSGTTHATLVADIYAWSEAHPPLFADYFIPGGFTYAMQPYRNGFLVTDAHHNRILRVRLTGKIGVFKDFAENVVPTGLERVGRRTVLIGQAGPVPHKPSAGRVVARRPGGAIETLASGAPLLVDVEVTAQGRLYGLAQGDWPYEGEEGKEGFPAAPHTGHLMLADHHGEFQSVVSGLDRPTTFEIIGSTVFVVTITGKVLRITGLSR